MHRVGQQGIPRQLGQCATWTAMKIVQPCENWHSCMTGGKEERWDSARACQKNATTRDHTFWLPNTSPPPPIEIEPSSRVPSFRDKAILRKPISWNASLMLTAVLAEVSKCKTLFSAAYVRASWGESVGFVGAWESVGNGGLRTWDSLCIGRRSLSVKKKLGYSFDRPTPNPSSNPILDRRLVLFRRNDGK